MMRRRNTLINGQRVAYWEANKQKQIAVILVHGLGGDHRGLIEFADIFNEFKVIIPDLPGWGLSEPLLGTHSVQNYVEFLDLFSNKIGLDTFYLIGHSFGGAIALMYAKKYPAKIIKVAVMNPVLENSGTPSWKVGRAYCKLASLLPSPVCHFLLSNKLTVYLTDAVVMTSDIQYYRKKILDEDYLNYRRANTRTMNESFGALDNLTMSDFTVARTTKAFILAGDKDKLQTSDYNTKLLTLFKPSAVKFIPGGHLLPLEDPLTAGYHIHQFVNDNP